MLKKMFEIPSATPNRVASDAEPSIVKQDFLRLHELSSQTSDVPAMHENQHVHGMAQHCQQGPNYSISNAVPAIDQFSIQDFSGAQPHNTDKVSSVGPMIQSSCPLCSVCYHIVPACACLDLVQYAGKTEFLVDEAPLVEAKDMLSRHDIDRDFAQAIPIEKSAEDLIQFRPTTYMLEYQYTGQSISLENPESEVVAPKSTAHYKNERFQPQIWRPSGTQNRGEALKIEQFSIFDMYKQS